jgi:hypothetical protein
VRACCVEVLFDVEGINWSERTSENKHVMWNNYCIYTTAVTKTLSSKIYDISIGSTGSLIYRPCINKNCTLFFGSLFFPFEDVKGNTQRCFGVHTTVFVVVKRDVEQNLCLRTP